MILTWGHFLTLVSPDHLMIGFFLYGKNKVWSVRDSIPITT
jgi:hypothetical protein